MFPGRDLSFSYETCGNVNLFLDGPNSQMLRDIPKLRVSYPEDASAVFPLNTDPHNKKRGSVVEFMHDIWSHYNIQLEVVPVSTSSMQYSPGSSFTACVHEVALNNTDLCIGNFWETVVR